MKLQSYRFVLWVAMSLALGLELRAEETKEGETNNTAGSEPIDLQHALSGDDSVRTVTDKRRFALAFDGYLRTELGTFWPGRFFGVKTDASDQTRRNPNIGYSDGFALADARLNLRGKLADTLYVRLGFDGAVASYNDAESSNAALITGLKDAYMSYKICDSCEFFVGRFKPPFDSEELTPLEEQQFVHRSLESRGVLRHEGPAGTTFLNTNNTGFAPGRQNGVMISGKNIITLGDDSGLNYALAVTNGNGGDSRLNDNDLPAVWGRLALAWGQETKSGTVMDEEGPATYQKNSAGMIGLSGFYNEITTGNAPNQFRDQLIGAGVDMSMQISMVQLQGQILGLRSHNLTLSREDAIYALGGHTQVAITLGDSGLSPGYRFAYLDPHIGKNDDGGATDQDRVMHHTLGMKYQCPEWPMIMYLEYTRSIEQAGRQTPNDRVEAALQVNFE